MSDPQPATALVTGATSGIGWHTAARLAAAGHSVLVTGRDHQRGQAAVAELRRRSGRDEVHFLRADHATVSGNLELAAAVSARVERLDLLVNNVGGIYADRWESADGYEGTLAMDFVGPFALTRCLLPLLRDTGGRRRAGSLQRASVRRRLHDRVSRRPAAWLAQAMWTRRRKASAVSAKVSRLNRAAARAPLAITARSGSNRKLRAASTT
jgi:short chain dehydrogenase